LSDADNNLNLLNEDYLISKKPNMYSGISYFKELNNKYPNQIDISLIGTHEKYLVRDGEFAMIGSHNFLTSSDYSKEREIGLITDDSSIISDLIDNYNKSIETDSFQNDDLDCPF
jgi:phosphatidylserine/phosphatidylglycerophosphate/cardiolipin synthase-like enzyme